MAETVEVLQRGWHVEGQSVRPDHRMVAHTGFLTTARLLVPGGRPIEAPAMLAADDPTITAATTGPGDPMTAGPGHPDPAGPGGPAAVGN
jgi:hypothetical protein